MNMRTSTLPKHFHEAVLRWKDVRYEVSF